MDQTNNAHVDEVGTRDEQELPTKGTVLSLHIAPEAHVPMTSLSSAHLVPGRGIVGDRFYLRRGSDATYDRFTCDVTLVEEETIEKLRGLAPRNGNVSSVSAQQVAPLESTEVATSCLVLPRADLRAEILTEGTIHVGDRLEIV